MGEPPGRLHDGQIASDGAITVVNQCSLQQSRYWRSMMPQEAFKQGSHVNPIPVKM
jgi:histone deacetylase 6